MISSSSVTSTLEHKDKNSLSDTISGNTLLSLIIIMITYYLEYLHPDPDSSESTKSSVQYIRDAVVRYFKNIAPDSEIRRLAFCLFGGTGSSWNGQVDELCALNHLQIKERIDVAELIYSKYTVANSTGSIRQPDAVLPDIKNFRAAIDSCYKAVADGKNEYTM